MGAAVLWPDVEAAAVAYLSTALGELSQPVTSGVHVSTRLPNPRPERAVIVRDDGGPPLGDVRAVARIGVNVWAATDADAADLAAIVTALINGWPDGKPVIRAVAGRANQVPDDSGQPLRYLTAEVWVRGTNL